jgi:aminopeptidase N
MRLPLIITIVLAIIAVLILLLKPKKTGIHLETGIPLELAQDRAQRLSDIRYGLFFHIPEQLEDSIPASLQLTFNLSNRKYDLALDFREENDHLLSVTVNGDRIEPVIREEHIVLPAGKLRKGGNQVDIEFIAGELSLNRSEEYLYTLLVPDRARTLFPCFDQPDLKARFSLQLELPAGWVASGNGSLALSQDQGERKLYGFRESAPIPTYLFAFAAGRFQVQTAERDGRPMTMLYRESDADKAAKNAEAIFDLHAHALQWLEEYTGIPYPFEKFDFVLIPTFQYGGMEHVGNIFYREGSLILDEGATTNQLLGRASLIAHETAHMWFGDLVTMQWFDDVWLKEVFANFMAAKIVNPSFPDINHELRFLLAHQPSAYGEDRSEGAHPIQQPLENLKDAGTLYGRIIYQKAPVVMRQLESLIGEQTFQEGLREYLQTFSFGNAAWDDLIDILDRKSELDLKQWSQVWVKEAGMPVISTEWDQADGKITTFRIRQEKTSSGGAYWTQQTTVALIYPDSIRQRRLSIQGAITEIGEFAGLPAPQAVLANASAISYGYFRLDEESVMFLLEEFRNLSDPVLRGAASLALYEEYLRGDRRVREGYVNSLMQGIEREEETLNRQLLLTQLTTIFQQFLSEKERAERAPAVEELLWDHLQRAAGAPAKRAYFNAYQSIALTENAVDHLRKIYEKELIVEGLPLSESDRNDLACELALRLPEEAGNILNREIAATQNPDRRKRLAFIRPALSPDSLVRDRFFESLKQAENRHVEPWVLDALGYLHHPLRAQSSEKFIRPSLELLEEIQATGDIFFPRRWVGATLSGHQSPAAAATVRQFLAGRPDYPYRLRNKILMGSDLLFRASEKNNPDNFPLSEH